MTVACMAAHIWSIRKWERNEHALWFMINMVGPYAKARMMMMSWQYVRV